MLQVCNFEDAPIAASGQESTPSPSMPSLKGFQNFFEIVRRLGAARVRSERLGGMCGDMRPGVPGAGRRPGGGAGPVPGGSARGPASAGRRPTAPWGARRAFRIRLSILVQPRELLLDAIGAS